METRHVLAGGMRRLDQGDNFVERQRRGVDNACRFIGFADDRLGDQRAGVKHNRGGAQQRHAAQGHEIGRAGTGADEMYRHGAALFGLLSAGRP